MANKYAVVNGELYANGVANEIKIYNLTGSDLRIKATGTGSCKVVGKLTASDDWKVLSLVKLNGFDVVDTVTDNEIYAADVSGIYAISVQNASGFSRVWATVLA